MDSASCPCAVRPVSRFGGNVEGSRLMGCGRHTIRLRSPCLLGTGRGRSTRSTTGLSSRSTRVAMGTVLRGTAAPRCCGCRRGWRPRRVSGTRSDTPPARRVLVRSDSKTMDLCPPMRATLQGRRRGRSTTSEALPDELDHQTCQAGCKKEEDVRACERRPRAGRYRLSRPCPG